MDEATGRPIGRLTIYDVAERAAVSHATVSRVLNGSPGVAESTRERVRAVMDELGFRPSGIARELASRRSARIGVLVNSPDQFGPNAMVQHIELAARSVGYGLHRFSMNGRHDDLAHAVGELTAYGIAALCVVAPRPESLRLLREFAGDVPVVVVGDVPEGEGLLSVGFDQGYGATLATAHLIELGHTSILHLSGLSDESDSRARAGAWRAAVARAGLRDPRLEIGDWTADSGFRLGASRRLMEGVTAVFAANDQMALGLVHGLRSRGVRVPDDISVVGFDDHPDARHFQPPLTTVRQDFAALAAMVTDTVLQAIGDSSSRTRVTIRPRLVTRMSTAPLGKR